MEESAQPIGNERKCLQCGKPLIKRAHESNNRYQAKKFDSASCSRAYMKANKMGWWSPEALKNASYAIPRE